MKTSREQLEQSTILLVEKCYNKRLTVEEKWGFYQMTTEELEVEHEYFQNLWLNRVNFI